MPRQLFALLVGIDDYPDDRFKLEGCVRDVELFQSYLEEHVPKGNDAGALRLQFLRNEEATRRNVIAGFRDHLAQAGKDDVALFYFCGHGSQQETAPEFRYLEPDGKDETLACWDSRREGRFDLADKELSFLLTEVAAQGAHVVVILDSCHSSSGTRALPDGPGLRVRHCGEDARPRPLSSYVFTAEDLPRLDFAAKQAGTDSGWLALPKGRHILLAACRSYEKAKELRGRGVFSDKLLNTLQAARGRLTYRDLLKRTAALVRLDVGDQNPQLEATHADDLNREFLSGALQSPPPYFTLSCDRSLGGWVIDGGAAHGIRPPIDKERTRLAVFRFDCPADQMRAVEQSLARVEVRDVGLGRSQVVRVEGEELSTATTYKAVVVGWPLPPVPVFLEGEPVHVAAVRQALEAAAAAGQGTYVREVAEAGAARLRLSARNDSYTIARSTQRSPLWVASRGGPADAVRVVRQVEHVSRWLTAIGLANSRSSIAAGEVRLEILKGEEQLEGVPIRLQYEYRDGQWQAPLIRIRVRNIGTQRRYCALLNCTDRFEIYARLFKFPGGGTWIEPRSKKNPDGGVAWALEGRPVKAEIPEPALADGVTEFGDWLVLLAADEEFDATLLEQVESVAEWRGTSRGENEVPPGVLNRLAARVQSRTFSDSAAGSMENWQATTICFTTVRPRDYHELPAAGAAVELAPGVSVVGHPQLRGKGRLLTKEQALQDRLGAGNDPDSRCELSLREPYWFTEGRGSDTGLSVLELAGLAQADAVSAGEPLRLRLDGRFRPAGPVVALVRDGDRFRPAGEVLPAGDGLQAAITRCPPPATPDESVFLFFYQRA